MTRRLYIERLRLRHLPAVKLATLLGWEVAAFDRDRDVKGRAVWRRMLARGDLRLLAPQPMRGCERAAIDAAGTIVDRLERDRTIRALERLFASTEAKLLAKRALAEQLSGVAFVHDRITAEAPERAVVIVDRMLLARRLFRRCEVEPLPLPPRTTVLGTSLSGRVREASATGVRTMSGAGRLFAKQMTQRLPGRRVPCRVSAGIGVAVSMPFLVKFRGPRSYDFLLGDELTADDVLFLVEFPAGAAFVADERARGRRLFETWATSSLGVLRRTDVRGPWLRESSRGLLSLIGAAHRPAFLADALLDGLKAHLAWNVFLRHVDIGGYVFANKEDRQQIAGNIVLRGAGVPTWNYSLFIGGPYQLDVETSPFDDRNAHWAFLNSDRWVVNNDAMRDNLAAHPNAVRGFDVIGNIFGELIDTNRSAQARDRLRDKFGLPVPAIGRTVAVFDTSFVDLSYGATTFDDAIAFLDDLERMVDALDEGDRVLFKPSKDEAFYVDPTFAWSSPVKGAEVVARQRCLASKDRVVWLDDSADTTEVSAVADLTVTHCFSSPTADALAAGLPAIWYESGDRFAGYPLDTVPGVVLHGSAALLAAVETIDPSMPAEIARSEELLRLVDPFLDGRALTRLRRLLVQDQQCMSENDPPANRRSTIGRP